jgi:hypothetical protein
VILFPRGFHSFFVTFNFKTHSIVHLLYSLIFFVTVLCMLKRSAQWAKKIRLLKVSLNSSSPKRDTFKLRR